MDRTAKLGMIITVVTVVFFAAMVGLVFGLFRYTSQLAAIERARTDRSAANANLIVNGTFKQTYAASATLLLPPVPPQRDSPSVQLSFFSKRGGFVQAGVIRSPHNHFRLFAFLAAGAIGERSWDRDLRALSDGPHVVKIEVRADSIWVVVDGARLYRLPRERYLPSDASPYVAIGTAVDYLGAAASGWISDVAVQRDGDRRLQPVVPTCIVSNGGIHLARYGTGWVLSGTHQPYVATTREGC